MSGPVRILHLRASNFVGGPEKQLLAYAATERHGAFQMVFGTFVDNSEGHAFLEAIENRGLPSLALPSRLLARENAFSRLRLALREQEITVLCTHGYKADILGILAARAVGIPVACFLRGWTGEDWKVHGYETIDRAILPLATRVVCLSETQAARLTRQRSLARKVRVIPNSVEFRDLTSSQRIFARQRVCTRLGIPDSAPIISMAGRLSPEKGAFFFLKAIPEILARHPLAHFVVFGDGALKQSLVQLTSALGITPQVHFAGFTPNFRDLLPGLDVLVNPSLSEEMPNVVLEGMAAGMPVVATNVGAIDEMAGPERAIEVVPSGQPLAIAHAVIGLLDSPRRAGDLGQRARRRVQREFSRARQQKCLLGLYQELIPGLPPQALSTTTEERGSRLLEEPIPENREGEAPFLSVVVPVRNEEKHLGRVLQDLLAQDYPHGRYEILVVDGNSTDATPRVVEEIAKTARPRIILLSNPRQLSSAGRNVGVRNSSGQIIVFVDGHCQIPSRKLLKDTAELFRVTGADCLCRPQPLTAMKNSWLQRGIADVRASALGHGLDSTIFSTALEDYVSPISSGASYKRAVFDQVGFYDERLDACEDVEFNHRVFRAGLRSYISPRLTVEYQPRNSIAAFWRQMLRYGRGRFRYLRIHPDAFSLGQVLPALFILWVLLGGVAAFRSKGLGVVYIATVALYFGAVMGSTFWLAIRNGWRHLFAGPGLYLTIHFGLGLGFLHEAGLSLLLGGSRTPPAHANSAKGTGKVSSSGVDTIVNRASVAANGNGAAGQVHSATTIGLKDIACDPKPLVNALSVDVEDYFHTEAMSGVLSREDWKCMPSRVQRNTHRLFELLERHNVRATFFFLGWVAERFPGLVQDAVRLGHEIGCHSFWHRPIYSLSPDEFRSDTLRAKETIENAGGVRVRGYRAPSFSLVPGTQWATEILAEIGFDYDSSVHPIRHDLYHNPLASRIPERVAGGAIVELPIATTRVAGSNLPIGGGGYLRIFPYAYTRWGLSRFNRRDAQPAIVYLHPWEIDPGQPRLEASPKARFRQYTGLATMGTKLTRMLKDFAFAPIATAFSEVLEERTGDCDARFESLQNTPSVHG